MEASLRYNKKPLLTINKHMERKSSDLLETLLTAFQYAIDPMNPLANDILTQVEAHGELLITSALSNQVSPIKPPDLLLSSSSVDIINRCFANIFHIYVLFPPNSNGDNPSLVSSITHSSLSPQLMDTSTATLSVGTGGAGTGLTESSSGSTISSIRARSVKEFLILRGRSLHQVVSKEEKEEVQDMYRTWLLSHSDGKISLNSFIIWIVKLLDLMKRRYAIDIISGR